MAGIPLTSGDDILALVIMGAVIFGGGILAFFSELGSAIIERLRRGGGGGGGRKLGKGERRELDRLRVENGRLKDVLREVKAYDAFAVNPLTTELSDKVRKALEP